MTVLSVQAGLAGLLASTVLAGLQDLQVQMGKTVRMEHPARRDLKVFRVFQDYQGLASPVSLARLGFLVRMAHRVLKALLA